MKNSFYIKILVVWLIFVCNISFSAKKYQLKRSIYIKMYYFTNIDVQHLFNSKMNQLYT